MVIDKQCLSCKEILPIGNFHKNKRRKTGCSDYCKVCSKKFYENNKHKYLPRYRESYRIDSSKRKESNLKSLENHRETLLLRNAKKRSKKDGVGCNLELSDIVIPKRCPLLGIELTTTQGKGKIKSNASIDRIDNSKGYVKGNIWVISHLANTMKNSASISDLIIFARNVKKIFDVECITTSTTINNTFNQNRYFDLQ